MRSIKISLAFGVSLVACAAHAQTAALSGSVSSQKEPVMEGVLVTVKKEGSSISTTVVTNDKGQYVFPADRLEPGKYAVTTRAIGYVLDGPKILEIGAGKDAKVDIKLNPTRNLATQLTNGEWLNSAHGAMKDKLLLNSCSGCHTYQRIFQSSHDADEWKQVFTRMDTYAQGSQPQRPQLLPTGGRGNRESLGGDALQATADYFASISLNGPDAKDFELKTDPRPKGKATRMIVTEYDLPRKTAMPHDVIVDRRGRVWYSDFGSLFVGEMDARTGKATDYPLPEVRKGKPHSTLDLQLDPNGNIWISMMYQAAVSMIDVETKEVKTYPYPDEWVGPTTLNSMVSAASWTVDGKVWSNNQITREQYRLDVATGKWENRGVAQDLRGKRISGYGMPVDKNNNVFMPEFSGPSIGLRSAKDNSTTIWETPIAGSRPRRGRVDEQGRLWFAEFAGNAIAMLDPASGKVTEWKMPHPYDWPYDVVPTKKGETWTGSMFTDLITRLDANTGEMTQFLLPRSTNVRRVFVDESGQKPVFWVGSNNGASIIKLETLD